MIEFIQLFELMTAISSA